MDWVQFCIFFVGVVGLFIWTRTESRADYRHLEEKMDEFRKENKEFHAEMKEFHARLFILEDRYLRIREREES